mgnify:CR=1 FL=1
MSWQSKPMTRDHMNFYIHVKEFTLVKETPKALRIRLEDHPKKICIWMAKKITRGYTGTSAYFWKKAFWKNVEEEEIKLINKRKKMEEVFLDDHNAIAVISTGNRDDDEEIIEAMIDKQNETVH